jgi:protoporphyrin/coproporphyrin ferrochelatase
VPESMAAASGPAGGLYPAQLVEAARLVAEGVAADGRERPWRLVYQSRSGPPSVPWLGPDVCDHLAELAASGAPGAVLVPVGFVSDHVEVRYDLDVEAVQLGQRLGLPLARAATPGTHPRFVSMITELVRERAGGPVPAPGERPTGERALGVMAPGPDRCPDGCCRPQRTAHGAGRPGGST